MKHLAMVLGLILLVLRGSAQSLQPVDMPFFINFSPWSIPSPESAIQGSANYYRHKLPIFSGIPAYTNDLEIFITWPSPPLATWIYEKQADDSLTRVVPITNLYDNGNGGYVQSQHITLTANQIHSLVAGNCYVGVDFGTSNYLGDISPLYNFANGPKAVMKFPPIPGRYFSNGYRVIAPDNRKIKMVLDGSYCQDPFYLSMKYSWLGWAGYFMNGLPLFTSTNMLATNVFAVGLYFIRLQADDVIHDGQPTYFYIEVRTAEQAVNEIITNWNSLTLPVGRKNTALEALTRAAHSFKRGQMNQGCREMIQFQWLVKTSHLDSGQTAYFLAVAQEIIGSFKTKSGLENN